MESLGGCRLLAEIGRGATGTVFKGERDGRFVAVKVLAERWADDASVTDRFVQEGLLLARLDHPGIVQVLDAGRERRRFFLVLEYVEGPSFERALRRRAFGARDAALIVAAVARAAGYAHSQGVVHADIVPGNILLKSDGTPKLADFGIARFLGEVTKAGVTAGTPVYMSPEQAGAKTRGIDGRSDVYSLGAVLYEAATGRAPFSGKSTLEILEKVVCQPPAPPRSLEPDVDQGLEAIVMRAMEKEPDRRYPSAEAFARALESWAEQAPDPWRSMISS